MTDEPHTGHPSGILVAFLPCNDLDASERFYNCLGFTRPGGKPRQDCPIHTASCGTSKADISFNGRGGRLAAAGPQPLRAVFLHRESRRLRQDFCRRNSREERPRG